MDRSSCHLPSPVRALMAASRLIALARGILWGMATWMGLCVGHTDKAALCTVRETGIKNLLYMHENSEHTCGKSAQMTSVQIYFLVHAYKQGNPYVEKFMVS